MRFEPTIRSSRMQLFKSCAINHSATLPYRSTDLNISKHLSLVLCVRQDSNLQPIEPQSIALPIALLTPCNRFVGEVGIEPTSNDLGLQPSAKPSQLLPRYFFCSGNETRTRTTTLRGWSTNHLLRFRHKLWTVSDSNRNYSVQGSRVIHLHHTAHYYFFCSGNGTRTRTSSLKG